jgi:hypothetical protein
MHISQLRRQHGLADRYTRLRAQGVLTSHNSWQCCCYNRLVDRCDQHSEQQPAKYYPHPALVCCLPHLSLPYRHESYKRLPLQHIPAQRKVESSYHSRMALSPASRVLLSGGLYALNFPYICQSNCRMWDNVEDMGKSARTRLAPDHCDSARSFLLRTRLVTTSRMSDGARSTRWRKRSCTFAISMMRSSSAAMISSSFSWLVIIVQTGALACLDWIRLREEHYVRQDNVR